jgi:TnpA family transposase
MPARVPMTTAQRDALLALPDAEELLVRHHSLDERDLAAVNAARTPETRLGYALQLCCLRYPGRHLRRGEVLPGPMLSHIAEQLNVEADVITGFARRLNTRYDQLAAIKARFGHVDLSKPVRASLRPWLEERALGLTDGRALLGLLLDELRARKIVISGITVVERMTAEAMYVAESRMITDIDQAVDAAMRARLDALVNEKTNDRQSRFSWLREPTPRVNSASLLHLHDKIDLIRGTGVAAIVIDPHYAARMAQFAREGIRYTAQAFQQMRPTRRRVMLIATLREFEVKLSDAAIGMFGSLVARAHLNARKRLELKIAAGAEEGRDRLNRVASVLEALTREGRSGGDIVAAVTAIASFDTIDADTALIRRTTRQGRDNAVSEIIPEYRTFKRPGPRFLRAFAFEGRRGTIPLRDAMMILAGLDGDWRTPLPDKVPLGHIERRWSRYVVQDSKVDRAYWEMATYSALASALAAGDIWVPTSRLHRSLDVLLTPDPGVTPLRITHLPDPHEWLGERAAKLDAALLEVAQTLPDIDPALFTGDRLRFPKEANTDIAERDEGRHLALRCYGLVPTMRITDVLSQVERWTGFTAHFAHVSTGLPPGDERAFLAALIAEATNLGLSRMAEVCDAAPRRALMRMQTWHMREDTFRAALACLTNAIHAEPMSAWFGDTRRASADGQAFHLGGPGEAGGLVNAHYSGDPIVKIYTTISGQYSPLHERLTAGTDAESLYSLDGVYGHESDAALAALHVDGGGVSDMVFAVSQRLGLQFQPRIPRLSDRRLYAFEPARRYGALAPLFGQRLNRELIVSHWTDIHRVTDAIGSRTVTPSLILRKLSAYRQQNSLAAALRELGRIERTLFTLRWFKDPALRRLVTAELNKGEARNSLARAVAFHRLGRFRDRGLENQQLRSSALTLVTAAIILYNCRYLGRAVAELQRRGTAPDPALLSQLSPLGWDRINLTGDYVWSDRLEIDGDGLTPLKLPPNP